MSKADLDRPTEENAALSRVLGVRMADSYRQMLDHYRQAGKASWRNADREARSAGPLDVIKAVALHGDPQRVSWWALGTLTEADPALAESAWERIRRFADDELVSGRRGAITIGASLGTDDPVDFARYLSVRKRLRDGWPPENAVEEVLLEMLSQSYACWMFWLDVLCKRAAVPVRDEREDINDRGSWRISGSRMSAEIEQAAEMVDRFSRIAARVLRILVNLRRQGTPLTIGQLNLGQSQLNITEVSTPGHRSRRATQPRPHRGQRKRGPE